MRGNDTEWRSQWNEWRVTIPMKNQMACINWKPGYCWWQHLLKMTIKSNPYTDKCRKVKIKQWTINWCVITFSRTIFSPPVGGGGGGVRRALNKVLGFAPRSKPLPFYTPFLIEKVPVSYTFHRKLHPFHIPTEWVILPFSLETPP